MAVTNTELNAKLDALILENQRILAALVITHLEFNKLSGQVDSLKETITALSKDAQAIVTFYAQIKKLEQEIFWANVRKPPKDSPSQNHE